MLLHILPSFLVTDVTQTRRSSTIFQA